MKPLLGYSAALRQVNEDSHLAEDVAQLVFTDLARKAQSLSARPALAGWLYTSTHFAATMAVRTERRRRNREQEAHLMHELLQRSEPDRDWSLVRPTLDAAMLELDESDREAVLLRYFENRPHAEIAVRLGTSENTARMRVERALERLHGLLTCRGIKTTATLSAIISANAVQAAPVGLAVTISTVALLAGTTISTTVTATAIKTIAMTTLQKTVITATLAVVAGFGIYEARQNSHLRQEIQAAKNNQPEYLQTLQREREDASNRVAWLTDELAKGKSNNLELLRLRGEVGSLRQQLESQKAQAATMDSKTAKAAPITFLSKAQITNAGFATPEAALQTHMHGLLSCDFDLFLSTFSAGDLNPNRYYGDSDREKFVKEWKKNSQEMAARFQGRQILAKHVISEDKVDLHVLYFEAGKFPMTSVQRMQKEGNQWRFRGSMGEAASIDSDEPIEVYTPSANQ